MKRNPVKKNMDKFHKPKTHKDKTKYNRKEKEIESERTWERNNKREYSWWSVYYVKDWQDWFLDNFTRVLLFFMQGKSHVREWII